jgi:hypothetical protein
MNSTLFLYLDILGFKQLIRDSEKIDWLFMQLDDARIHQDSNYRSIVFSDTLIAYNTKIIRSREAKTIEVMFLIELVQEFLSRLVGSGISFRAIITEGDFQYKRLHNIDAYYGQALVKACEDEKEIGSTGLYLDHSLSDFNSIFKTCRYSDRYDFVFVTQKLYEIEGSTSDYYGDKVVIRGCKLPIPNDILGDYDELGSRLYEEVIHLRDIFHGLNTHQDEKVRSKYCENWKMYETQYPNVTRCLCESNFDPRCLTDLDWTAIEEQFAKRMPLWVSNFGNSNEAPQDPDEQR